VNASYGDTRITEIAIGDKDRVLRSDPWLCDATAGTPGRAAVIKATRHDTRYQISSLFRVKVFTAAHKNSIRHCRGGSLAGSETLGTALYAYRHKRHPNTYKIGERATLDDGLAVITRTSEILDTAQLTLIDSLPAVVEHRFVDCRDCRGFYIALLNKHRNEIQRALIKGAINFTH